MEKYYLEEFYNGKILPGNGKILPVPRNFTMEKYCLEELLVNRLRGGTSK